MRRYYFNTFITPSLSLPSSLLTKEEEEEEANFHHSNNKQTLSAKSAASAFSRGARGNEEGRIVSTGTTTTKKDIRVMAVEYDEEEEEAERVRAFKGVTAVVVVYDITRKLSFDKAVGKWVSEEIAKRSGGGVRCVAVVGNKSDMENSRVGSEAAAKRIVAGVAIDVGDCCVGNVSTSSATLSSSSSSSSSVATTGSISTTIPVRVFETSAKTGAGVEQVFEWIAKTVHDSWFALANGSSSSSSSTTRK